MPEKQAQLYRMDTHEHTCPFGLKSKDLLRRKGYAVDDHRLTSREETDRFKVEHQVDTTPQTFIDGQRIGGYDDLRVHFGLDEPGEQDAKSNTYQPVIALFGMAALITLALCWGMSAPLLSFIALKWFVALSMCLLAVQKLQDLESFSLQFLGYDLLAQKRPRYAYFYPFAEGFAGLGMLAGLWTPLIAAPALFIGSIGAISVFKAVYIDKRELRCACVGGDSKVPLGAISLTENLMMVVLPLWMLLRG